MQSSADVTLFLYHDILAPHSEHIKHCSMYTETFCRQQVVVEGYVFDYQD